MSDNTAAAKTGSSAATIVLALTPFMLGYFMSYLYRAVNAVVAPDLVKDISLGASELGLLTAAYLFSFALFQLPLGILLDRYGPRKVQAGLLLCAAVGSFFFAIGENVLTLTLARALIGIGFAGGLMGGFKAVVVWVPPQRRALANAVVMSAGALGLLVATVPMEHSVQAFGWRAVFTGLTAITAISALIVFFVVPRRSSPSVGGTDTLLQSIKTIRMIYSDRSFWVLAPLLATTASVQIAVQTLWAGPWFRDVAGFDRDGVAIHLFITGAAFFFGTLFSGAVADWFGRRGVHALTVMIGFVLLFIGSQIGLVLEWTQATVPLWIVFGMSGQAVVLAFPWLSTHFGEKLSGRANTAMNLLIFSSAFAVQYLIGRVIDLFPPTATGGYAPEAYQVALGFFGSLQIAALVWYFVGRSRLEHNFEDNPDS